ncbi:oligopeptide/dipeptide ABC transporter ATP-binding protein, partial [Micromonospora tarensis]
LSAAPVADPARQRQRQPVLLGDDLPSALDPPSGCRFRTRCRSRSTGCATQVPAQTAIGDGMAACHLVRPDGTGPDVRSADPSEVLS